MKPSIAVKTVFASLLQVSGILDGILKRRPGAAVLMYHRVLPRGEAVRLRVQPGLFVRPDTFEAHLRYLAGRFEIVPLREVQGILEGRRRSTRPACVLTFDDGWRDFRLHAFPLLQRHGVPATVFLPTDYLGEGNGRFWSDRLADILADADACGSVGSMPADNPLARRIAMLRGDRGSRLEAAIGILKGRREEEIERVLAGLSGARAPQGGAAPVRDFLSWDEVREMASSGLVSYGSHTASHRILTTLSRDEVREELERSRARLLAEDAADPDFIPFCYPNGEQDAGIAAAVREAGYGVAVTTAGGWNGRGDDPFLLKRIAIHEDMASTPALFGCRLAGIL